MFGCCRYVYNWALRLRADAYRDGTPLNYNATPNVRLFYVNCSIGASFCKIAGANLQF
jgi:hypothetical protein